MKKKTQTAKQAVKKATDEELISRLTDFMDYTNPIMLASFEELVSRYKRVSKDYEDACEYEWRLEH